MQNRDIRYHDVSMGTCIVLQCAYEQNFLAGLLCVTYWGMEADSGRWGRVRDEKKQSSVRLVTDLFASLVPEFEERCCCEQKQKEKVSQETPKHDLCVEEWLVMRDCHRAKCIVGLQIDAFVGGEFSRKWFLV